MRSKSVSYVTFTLKKVLGPKSGSVLDRQTEELKDMEGTSIANETENELVDVSEVYCDPTLDNILIEELLEDNMGEMLEGVETVPPTGEKGRASLVHAAPTATTTGEGREEQRLTGGTLTRSAQPIHHP